MINIVDFLGSAGIYKQRMSRNPSNQFLSRWVSSMVSETIGIELIKNIAAETVADGGTPTAYRANRAGTARYRSGPKAAGRTSMIDVIQWLLIHVANWRRHFPAGMHFAVRQQGDEVKSRTTTVS